ncbi:carboxypeptidase-like regulatory domain-containing protein [Phnomibacter ginsenosidimutans]|uniref:carboxypeptidase-like regulatory domain-containing protein n=1 Tax=Phnomibacter ginsenosidimutans TaxID=2676868 RepID=UPI0018D2585E|nr:carboxypeptidase-like regulatory domain-containing protein [Phnomibacter ginsenosidimutans]
MRKFMSCCLLLCVFVLYEAQAQTRKVTGKVTDEQGAALSGATVSVKQTAISTLTDAKGAFTIEVPATGKTLLISYVGMETLELPIQGKNNVTAQLKTQASALGDVVVIGYGSVRKTDATGAVQRLTREDLLRDNPSNILQAMQGKLAGVNVTQNDGAPGAGLSIRVRGSNSFWVVQNLCM